MKDNQLTKMRREHVGFVFQSFNLLGMLTARQNILLPFDLAGRSPGLALARHDRRRTRLDGPAAASTRPNCPAVSSNGSRSPARW